MLRLSSTRRVVPAGALHNHGSVPLRPFAPLAVLLAATLLIAPGAARADTSSTFTVVGSTDVNDSGLISKVIAPAFEANYPQYAFKYVGAASGTAITDAETGSVGASALIVHAPSLENQFVAGGYSEEPYGRALFANDYVLAGPGGDPAAVKANAAHNIAQAFGDVAAAGIAGKATFVSRGGTSGTTIAEHQIWPLVAQSGLQPPGLVLCAVNAADGGGETPIAPGAGVANGQPCPKSGAPPTGSALPAWYASTGLSQALNVLAADACSGYSSGPSSCYAFTDRGTYDYLLSGTDTAGTIVNITSLTSENYATAPGGQYELENYYHGYIINPAKLGAAVNLTAAQDFLDLITSAPIQAAISTYLDATTDPEGAPYTPTAAPLITTKRPLPEKYVAAKPITLTGTVANAQPGLPVPAGIVVSVHRVTGDITLPVASVKTSSTGAFTLTFTPKVSGSYTLSTPQFSQIEEPTLSPTFGDILSPAVTDPSYVSVHGAISDLRAHAVDGHTLVLGSVSPDGGHVNGRVTVSARRLGTKDHYRRLTTVKLGSTDGRFAAEVALSAGKWQIETTFSDQGTLTTSRPRTTVLTVKTGSSSRIEARGQSVSRTGTLTTHVAISPGAVSGSELQLIVVKLSGGGTASSHALDTVKLKAGARSATLRGGLKGPGRWAVLASYSGPGQVSTSTRTLSHATVEESTKKK